MKVKEPRVTFLHRRIMGLVVVRLTDTVSPVPIFFFFKPRSGADMWCDRNPNHSLHLWRPSMWLNLKGTPEALSQILASVWESDATEWLYQRSSARSLHQKELQFIRNHNKIRFLNADNHTTCKPFLSVFRLKALSGTGTWSLSNKQINRTVHTR